MNSVDANNNEPCDILNVVLSEDGESNIEPFLDLPLDEQVASLLAENPAARLDIGQAGAGQSDRNDVGFTQNNTGPKQKGKKSPADRKKEQNRSAQRAFRERKEIRMRELQEQYKQGECTKKQLLEEVEKLRQWNSEIGAENRKLSEQPDANAAVSGTSGALSRTQSSGIFSFPTAEDCYPKSSQRTSLNTPTPELDPELLTVPHTWEYLQKLSETLDFDIYFIMSELKGHEKMHCHGPAYEKVLIDETVRLYLVNSEL